MKVDGLNFLNTEGLGCLIGGVFCESSMVIFRGAAVLHQQLCPVQALSICR